jgi:hypothetical protein
MIDRSEPGYVTIIHRTRIKSPITEEGILVPMRNWDSLARRVETLQMPFRLHVITYSVAFTIAFIATFALIPMAYYQLPGWALTVVLIFCVSGIGVGFGLALSQGRIVSWQQSQMRLLAADMERIRREGEFTQPDGRSLGE